METAEKVREGLKEKGYPCSLINSRFVKPLDVETIEMFTQDHALFVTIEEATVFGGLGSNVTAYFAKSRSNVKVLVCGVPDTYVEHGNIDELRKVIGLTPETIIEQTEITWKNIQK